MADYATKQDTKALSDKISSLEDSIDAKITKAVDDLSEVIGQFSSRVDERFNKVEKDIAELKESHNRLMDTLDAFLKRLDDIEVNNAARDRQLERLETWIKQVAQKTGVKLEY
jgi:chromosome segregation ATPase